MFQAESVKAPVMETNGTSNTVTPIEMSGRVNIPTEKTMDTNDKILAIDNKGHRVISEARKSRQPRTTGNGRNQHSSMFHSSI